MSAGPRLWGRADHGGGPEGPGNTRARLSFLAETLRRMGISPQSPFCGISGPQARCEGAEWVLKPRNGPFQGRHGGPADRSGPRFPRRGAMPPFPRRPRASIPTLSSRRSHAAGPALGSGAGRGLHSHARRPPIPAPPGPRVFKKSPYIYGGPNQVFGFSWLQKVPLFRQNG